MGIKCLTCLCAAVWFLPFAYIYACFSLMNLLQEIWKTIILGFSRSRIRGYVFAEKVRISESWRSCTVQLFWIGGYANIKGREAANITFDVSDYNIHISKFGGNILFEHLSSGSLLNWQYILLHTGGLKLYKM